MTNLYEEPRAVQSIGTERTKVVARDRGEGRHGGLSSNGYRYSVWEDEIIHGKMKEFM